MRHTRENLGSLLTAMLATSSPWRRSGAHTLRLSLEQSLSSLESQVRWAMRAGLGNAAGTPNYLNYVYTAPLAGVLPAAVSILK